MAITASDLHGLVTVSDDNINSVLDSYPLKKIVNLADLLFRDIIKNLTIKKISTQRGKLPDKPKTALTKGYHEMLAIEVDNYFKFRDSPTGLYILGTFGNKHCDKKYIKQFRNKKYEPEMRIYAKKAVLHILKTISKTVIIDRILEKRQKNM